MENLSNLHIFLTFHFSKILKLIIVYYYLWYYIIILITFSACDKTRIYIIQSQILIFLSLFQISTISMHDFMLNFWNVWHRVLIDSNKDDTL